MVKVIGAALTDFNRRRDGSSFRDWAADAFDSALTMSGLDRKDIESLVVASESDFFSLQLNPASILAQELGLIGAQTLRVEGGGASGQLAVHAGVAQILSGQASHVAVLGFDSSAGALSGENTKKLYGYSFDFWTDGLNGASATALYALSWQSFAEQFGANDNDLHAVAKKNRSHALANPTAHLPRDHTTDEIANSPIIASPYRRLHCSPLSDGAAAIILSAEDRAPSRRQQTAPSIVGIGASSDFPNLGHRADAGVFSAKTKAVAQALLFADLAVEAINFAEVYDAYAGAELQAIHSLGLSDDPVQAARTGEFGRDGRCPINLSGGLLGQGAPAGAIGVGQTATCALILEGRYHADLQPSRTLGHALADTHGGVGTSAAVTVLSAGQSA